MEQALAHPTWTMGAKITVDSATMMNKGLEIIEAHHLFGMAEDRIDVIVHPESRVHSLVEYADGTLIAQLSVNDMRFPILYALAYPDRLPTPFGSLDLVGARRAPLRGRRRDALPLPAASRARRCAPAGRSRRCSTPRTRSPSRRSCRVGLAFTAIPGSSRRRSNARRPRPTPWPPSTTPSPPTGEDGRGRKTRLRNSL